MSAKNGTLITGVVFAAATVAMVVLWLTRRESLFFWLGVVGLLMIITTFVFMWPSVRDYPPAVASGPLVSGTLTGVKSTGFTVFGRPQATFTVSFATMEGHPVTAETTRAVERGQYGGLAPGVTVPVRYDPNQPSHMMIVFDGPVA